MKKITLIFTLISALGFAQVTNGTFDSDISGWTTQGSPTSLVHESAEGDGLPLGAMKLVASGTSSGAKTSPNAAPGNTGVYILKFRVKGEIGTKIQGAVYQGSLISGDNYTLETADWEDYSYTFHNIDGATNLNVRIIGKTDTKTFYIDNVTFEEATLYDNYVLNGDFETGGGSTTNWIHTNDSQSSMGTITGTDGAGADTGTAAALTFSASQTGTSDATYFDNDIYDLGEDRTTELFTITFDAKTTGAGAEYQAVFKLYDAADGVIGSLSTGVTTIAADGAWHPIEFNKANNLGAFRKIQVRIKIRDGANSSEVVAIDNVVSSFVDPVAGIFNKPKQDLQVSVYPNPVNDVLRISKDVATVEVFNILGQRIISASNVNSIDTSSLENGSYIVKLTSDEGLTASKRIFKK